MTKILPCRHSQRSWLCIPFCAPMPVLKMPCSPYKNIWLQHFSHQNYSGSQKSLAPTIPPPQFGVNGICRLNLQKSQNFQQISRVSKFTKCINPSLTGQAIQYCLGGYFSSAFVGGHKITKAYFNLFALARIFQLLI